MNQKQNKDIMLIANQQKRMVQISTSILSHNRKKKKRKKKDFSISIKKIKKAQLKKKKT